jgi:hypothetical protein
MVTLSAAFACQNGLEKWVKVMSFKIALYNFVHTECGRTMSPHILYRAFHILEGTVFKLRALFLTYLHHFPHLITFGLYF